LAVPCRSLEMPVDQAEGFIGRQKRRVDRSNGAKADNAMSVLT
jgi:hypothetical protein